MNKQIKAFAGDTLIYGVTTMTGRLLNWLMMPFYIRVLSTHDYGTIVNIYSLISILVVIFVYGFETSFFRFARDNRSHSVYKTSLTFLASSSILLFILAVLFAPFISSFYTVAADPSLVVLIGLIVGFDCLLAIPFANLRLQNKALKFSLIKLIGISINIVLNLLFLLIIPHLIGQGYFSQSFVALYNSKSLVFYVLLSNALSNIILFFFFLSDIISLKGFFEYPLLKDLLKYSWPILLVGITGMITMNVDKILMPRLLNSDGLHYLAIYGANFKIGVLMSLFTQSFRMAFEPFFFKNRDKGKEDYATLMDYFIFSGLLIFIIVTLFIDYINLLLIPEYIEGNTIIPFILLGHLFHGIFFNLSLWYKLTDRTLVGGLLGTVSMIIVVVLNLILVPIFGFIGSAYAFLTAYVVVVVISYFMGKFQYPVPYKLTNILYYFVFTGLVYFINQSFYISSPYFSIGLKVLFIGLFLFLFVLLHKRSLNIFSKNG